MKIPSLFRSRIILLLAALLFTAPTHAQVAAKPAKPTSDEALIASLPGFKNSYA